MPLQLAGRRLNLAWTLFGVIVVLVVFSLVIGWTGGETWSAVFGSIPVALAFAVAGALVAARTGNRLGWLFLAAGTATAVTVLTNVYAARSATAELAALFSPLRRRVQRMVDRRFNRVRYDADQTVAAFAARLRGAVELDTVRADLLAVVTNAVEPAQIVVWIAGDGQKPSA